jgi:HlyD family secretion protein
MGLVADIFNSDVINRLEGTAAIGHNRYSTTGSTSLKNCQPLVVEYAGGGLALAHNGNLVNFAELRERLEANGSLFQSSSDSEVIIHLIAGSHAITLRERVAEALAQVRGSQADVSAQQSGGNREEVLTLEVQLVKSRNERDTAQRNLEALKRLQQQGAASPGEVKQAEDQLGGAEADLKLVQQKQKERYSQAEIARVEAQTAEAQSAYAAAENILRQLNIRAPFDGIVYSLPVHQGAYVNAGDLVLQEADLSKVLVRAYVDEPDVGRLARGQRIDLTWDAVPGRTWQGSVSTIPSTVKLLGTRNVGETTCVVDNQDFKLLPNINVGVTIVTAEHQNALTVPRESVRLDDGKTFVYQIVNNELQRRDIQTSISNLTQVEVANGITDNVLVALASTNHKPLRAGTTGR